MNLVIRTRINNPELVKYLKQNGLTTDADKTVQQVQQIVNTIVGVSWITAR